MITYKTRMSRLQRLDDVLQLHRESKGKSTKLNGCYRDFNMGEWDCTTSACAFGSYALTPYGKRHFHVAYRQTSSLLSPDFEGIIVHKPSTETGIDAAVEHFGISEDEAEWLFMPYTYKAHDRTGRAISPYSVQRRVRSLMKKYENGKGEVNDY